MKWIFLVLPFIFLLSCSNKASTPQLFTPGVLAQQLFVINGSKDTLLETLHGSIIRVAAGSFNNSGSIKLEIREAFSPAEMLLAGLVTESNGRPLRSGGMIYINANADGKAAELIKPLKVSVPNLYYDSAMQVFKGIETDSAGVNWVDPTPVDSTPQAKNWLVGKALFNSKCRQCHAIFKSVTGPALAGLENRGPWRNRENIYEYIHNPARFIEQNSYLRNLVNEYKTVMQAFPTLDKNSIDAILDYIRNEEKNPGALEEEMNYTDSLSRLAKEYSIDTGTVNSKDPCGRKDTFYIPPAKQSQSFFADELSPSTTNSTGNDFSPSPPVNNNNKPRALDSPENRNTSFTDPNPTDGMYDFEIKTLGWYNIDAWMEGYAGTTNVKIWADLQMDIEPGMHLYLFCPDKQILSVGNVRQDNKYFFDKINGGVPLFLNDKAILFAFGSKGDKMYYGISEFTIRKEQTIPVIIKETTDTGIREVLLDKRMNGIDIGIEKKEKVIVDIPCDENKPAADTAKALVQ